MEYHVFSKNSPVIALRLDPGEEVVASILEVAEKEKIAAATIEGLGATDEVIIGIMDLESKEYKETEMKRPFEITALHGNLSRKDGEAYLHSHINLGGVDGIVYGGHLQRAVISVTAEIFIRTIEGTIDREFDEKTGVNRMIF